MLVENLLKVALFGSEWVMWLLIALSVVSFGAMVERFVYFRRFRAVGTLGDDLVELLDANETEKAAALLDTHGSLEAGVLRRALVRLDGGADALADSIAAETARLRKDLERGVNLLGTLGNNAPFIGLFGTVIGVIVAFHQLAGGNDKAAMGSVMGGIAEALVATGVGLFVAIPAVVAYNVVQKKVGDIEGNIEVLARQLGALIRTFQTKERALPVLPPRVKATKTSSPSPLLSATRREA